MATTAKKPTAKQLAARKKFAEMARSGVFAAKKPKKGRSVNPAALGKISVEEVQRLLKTNHVVLAYPRRGEIVVDGFKRYEASKAAIAAAQARKSNPASTRMINKFCVEYVDSAYKKKVPRAAWSAHAAFTTFAAAEEYARMFAKSHPDLTVRVVSQ